MAAASDTDAVYAYALKELDTHGDTVLQEASTSEQLLLYGFYKQAKHGRPPPSSPVPSVWDVRNYQKYRSWKRVQDLSSEDARKGYLQVLLRVLHRTESLSELEQSLRDRLGTTAVNLPETTNITEPSTTRWPHLLARGTIDVTYTDLWRTAIGARAPPAALPPTALTGYSVRTLLDLFLRVRQYPSGSEIIMVPPITIPHVRDILEFHRISVVGVDPEDATTAVSYNLVDLERRITPETCAIFFVHVFGHRVRIDARIRKLADRHGLDVLEDAAQAFDGTLRLPDYVDVSWVSFGLIKTSSSVQGGVALVRDAATRERMTQLLQGYPVLSHSQVLRKLVNAALAKYVSESPRLLGVLYECVQFLGLDWDVCVSQVVRSYRQFTPSKVRRRPGAALEALLRRRLASPNPVVASRRQVTQELRETLATDWTVPRLSEDSVHWLCPVLHPRAPAVCRYLRQRGIDATQGASQLTCVDASCVNARSFMERVVYVPVSPLLMRAGRVDPVQKERLVAALKSVPENLDEYERVSRRRGWMLRLCCVMLLWYFPRLVCYGSLVFVIAIHVLQRCCGPFYLKSSKTFVRYCSLVDEQQRKFDAFFPKRGKSDQPVDEGAGESTAEDDRSVLSSMKVLDLPSVGERETAILLTGATGFVGSMVLRDILMHRKHLQLQRIVLLCRTKRNLSAVERIQKLLDEPMYSFLPKSDRERLVKVIECDFSVPGLGLSSGSIETMRGLTHVIHAAADVSFQQSLPQAALTNISSPLELARLCRERLDNPRFIHISTAFVHGGLTGSHEDPLPEALFSFGKYRPREIYWSMCNTQFYASKAMHDLGFANTYTFSKSVCEHLMLQENPDTIIIRPSIVGPSVELPYEGWAGRQPSTFVGAACLYLTYQWNLWSFGRHRVASIPVDVLSRYVIRKCFDSQPSFHGETASDDSSSLGFEKVKSSSDSISFEKIKRIPSLGVGSASDSTVTSSSGSRSVYTAAWNPSCASLTQFSWFEYAAATVQLGSVVGHCDRLVAAVGLTVTCRILPKLDLSSDVYDLIHRILVKLPFETLLRLRRSLSLPNRGLERLGSYLDLPVLFFPFMNSTFYFESDLQAPLQLDGERYMFSCVVAAHLFVRRIKERRRGGSSHASLLGTSLTAATIFGTSENNRQSNGVWWALTQPNGNVIVRLAGLLLSGVFRCCYSHGTADLISMAEFRRCLDASTGRTLVLAPTHRSYMDFLVLSYVCFAFPELHIDMPRIAAADEFRRMPLIALAMRLLGAFFVKRRRSQKDPRLSSKILSMTNEPADELVLELFIEGTRSRDRRFCKPKTGLLKCLNENLNGYTVAPVAISHERIAEQASLSQECSGGAPVCASVSRLVGWLKDCFSRKIDLGSVHVAGGPPLEVTTGEIDWTNLALSILKSQSKAVVVSDYHIRAGSAVLDIPESLLWKELSKAGARLFPISPRDSQLSLPKNSSELMSVFLQAAHCLKLDDLSWNQWLCPFEREWLGAADTSLIGSKLKGLLASASASHDKALRVLEEKGYHCPEFYHVLSVASSRCSDSVPKLLLSASLSRNRTIVRQPTGNGLSTDVNLSPKTTVARRRVGSEALGFWGFYDTMFVVRLDKNGGPFVSMEGDRYSLRGKRLKQLLPFIQNETAVPIDPLRDAFLDLPDNECPFVESRISRDDIQKLESVVARVSTDESDRVRHGTGHSQQDVMRIRSKRTFRIPDIVVWPNSEVQVSDVISLARDKRWCVIPFGGGTNVTCSTLCPSIEKEPRPIVSLDTSKLNRVLSVNETDGLAHIQAGITGRALETELGRRGFTMGHEPDSIEFSTLGGWIATKASGMKRGKYGNIEDIVQTVHVVGASDDSTSVDCTAHGPPGGRVSCGVDTQKLVFGSEGCLGVITSATVRIWPVPTTKEHGSIIFPSWKDGVRFLRELSDLGDMPSCVRLIDNDHLRLGLALSPEQGMLHSMLRSTVSQLGKWLNGLNDDEVVCATILYEGTAGQVRRQKRSLEQMAKKHGGTNPGARVGRSSYDMTFMIAYLRDFALSYYLLGESFETWVPWSKLESMIVRTKQRIHDEHADRCLPGRPFVASRITQVYHSGVCVYFYLCFNVRGVPNASEVFTELEHAARQEILEYGGSLSHHHGLGKVRTIPPDCRVYAVKDVVDPDNVFGARNGSFA